MSSRIWPKRPDPRRPVFHEWFFSTADTDQFVLGLMPGAKSYARTKETTALMLRDKDWTVVAAFELFADYASSDYFWSECSLAQLTLHNSCHSLHLINSLIDAGALDVLPQPWRNQRNPLQQLKVLLRDTMQRLVQRVEPKKLQNTGVILFGTRIFAVEFLSCILRILRHGDTEGARATEDEIVEFFKFLLDVKPEIAYCGETRLIRSCPVAQAMNDLIRFLFIPASSNNNNRQSDSHCFVARLLGLSGNNDVPERIGEWLCAWIARCPFSGDSAVLWYELVADLFCNAPSSVISAMISMRPSRETSSLYLLVLNVLVRSVAYLFTTLDYDGHFDDEVHQRIVAHQSRAIAALTAMASKNHNPAFSERIRFFLSAVKSSPNRLALENEHR